MQKKIIALCLLVMLLAMGCAEAAVTEITDFKWKVNANSVLRVVFECSAPTNGKAVIKNNELLVTINGRWNAKKAKNYTFKSEVIKQMKIEVRGNKTFLHLPLKKSLSNEGYRVFTLKKAPTFKRPDRVVLDVVSGNVSTLAAANISKAGVFKPIAPSYRVLGGIKGKRICLDAGHGGSDPGAIGKQGTQEKLITLPITLKLRERLKKKGAVVFLTRDTDTDVFGIEATDKQELQARVDVAERNKADLFLSLHCNANNNRAIGGFSTYYNSKTKYDKKVADCIQGRLLKSGKLKDLGVRHANFYVNKRCSMPGALLEMLFLSNPREEKLLKSNWFQNKIADAIAAGVEDFYKQIGGGGR